jgi:nicotinamidase-related amidase
MTDDGFPGPWWVQLFESRADGGYTRAHWTTHGRLGARPALLVIDAVRSFTGHPGQTLEQATAVYPTACGPSAWTAMPALARVIRLADERGWPIVYTTALPGGAAWFGGTVRAETAGLGSPMDLPGAQDIPA